jgi:hypothetical protein
MWDNANWDKLFAGYVAAVDEPPAAFWRELHEVCPHALVILSLPEPESWWESADETVFYVLRDPPPLDPPFMADWHVMTNDLYNTHFPGMLDNREKVIAAFKHHNNQVREVIPADQLLEWYARE